VKNDPTDDGADVDPGEPVAALAGLVQEPSPDFAARVRRRIERRSLASQFLLLTWHMPVAVLLEFLVMIVEICFPGRSKGGSP